MAQTVPLNAKGIYSDSSTADLTSQVAWVSGNTAIASVATGTGVVTGATIDTTAVTAAINGVASNSASVTVIAAITNVPGTPRPALDLGGIINCNNSMGTQTTCYVLRD